MDNRNKPPRHGLTPETLDWYASRFHSFVHRFTPMSFWCEGKKNWEPWLKIAYKILHDTLFLLLLVFCGTLVAEAVLPGLLSSRLSFTKIILAIFANITAIILIARKIELPAFNFGNKKSKLVAGLFFFSLILIANSLLKFGWLENAVITSASGAILFFFYRIFNSHENN